MAVDACRITASALRDVGNRTPSATQDCSDVVHLLVFFDGTGNNKKADEVLKKWSNVARIWRSAYAYEKAHKNANVYSIYISGVGTSFNGKAFFPGEEALIDIEDGDILGAGTGRGGSRRLNFGQQKINNALRDALLGRAKILGGKVAAYAAAGKSQSFSEVNRALGGHRLIKQINVSIFGFSRGAALARAFCNEWLWECEENRGKLSYAGYPIRFSFLGLFDTVASFGLPAQNKPNELFYGGFKGRDLVVDEHVERCVHFVAAHELRFAFPVDLIRRDGQLAGRWLETVYPGVHSDIGGGYEPKEQGIDDNYSRIPMRDMTREALLQGTRIFSYEDLGKRNPQIFKEIFECRPETEKAHQAYVAVCNPGGTVEQQVREHMKQLYSAYGRLHRQGGESVTEREHRIGTPWSDLAPDDMATELESYERTMDELAHPGLRSLVDPTFNVRKGAYALWISPEKWQLDAWKRNAAPGVMNFVHKYLHDSKVGFLSDAEPFSYFSNRGIAESMHSVQGWFEENVERPVDHAYEATVDATNRAIDKGVEVAKKAEAVVVDKAQQAQCAIAETAEKAQRAATEAARKAEAAVVEKAQQAQQVISETADKVGRATTEAATRAKEAADAAWQQGQRTMTKAGEAVGRATQDAVSGLQSAWDYLF